MTIIDLSKIIQPNMECYPGNPKVEIETVSAIEENGWEVKK